MVKPRRLPAPAAPGLGERECAERIAYNIRAELVCCDAYDRFEYSEQAEEIGHGLCYWGEASARLAEHTAGLRTDEN